MCLIAPAEDKTLIPDDAVVGGATTSTEQIIRAGPEVETAASRGGSHPLQGHAA